MADNTTTRQAKDVSNTVREQAETNVQGAQKALDAYVDVTLSSIRRSQELAERSYKAWNDALGGGSNLPTFGIPTSDIREFVSAGFDLAKGVLDAEREIANQLVDAFASARS